MSDNTPKIPNHQNIGLDNVRAEEPKATNVPRPTKPKK